MNNGSQNPILTIKGPYMNQLQPFFPLSESTRTTGLPQAGMKPDFPISLNPGIYTN